MKITENINNAFLKRLKKLSNKELILKLKAFKVANQVYSNFRFQRNYETILYEGIERGFVK